jgi:uncharacterized protein DUF3224
VTVPRATGTFEVKLAPVSTDDDGTGNPLARFSIEKRFSGDLTGTSTGEMMSAGSPAKGSAGYVAMERVNGTLSGRTGSFVFQHSATMHRGVNTLLIQVVPATGTGELTGLAGTLAIVIEGGKHSYEFDYELTAG